MDAETMMIAKDIETACNIGNNYVRVRVRVGREGIHLLASLDVGEYLPEGTSDMERLMEGLKTTSSEMTWDQIDAAGKAPLYRRPDEAVRDRANLMAHQLVRDNLSLKPAGVMYCDGTD